MLDAAKTRPSSTPSTIAPMLNSFGESDGETYGANGGVSGPALGGVNGVVMLDRL